MGRIRQATLRRSAAAALGVRVIVRMDFKKYHSSHLFREFAESQAKRMSESDGKQSCFVCLTGKCVFAGERAE